MQTTKLIIADDHTLFRQGLRSMLDLEASVDVVGEATTGREAIALCEKCEPDVVLMDVEMPGINGIEATREIKADTPQIGVIMLTMHTDDSKLFEAIKEGANGYVLKECSIEQLVEHIQAVATGASALSAAVTRRVLDKFARISKDYDFRKRSHKTLTGRESEILSLLSEGKANKEIARSLFISEKTVKNHVSNIYAKLDCHDRTSAVVEGVRRGLIRVDPA